MTASGEPGPPVYAVFVSSHGFGHAARASAVMLAAHEGTAARFELFTTVPRWFFDETVDGLYRYHEVETDVGLRQKDALEFDLEATVTALDALLPFDDGRVDELADRVLEAGCRVVLCDIAPLGIAVAERAGLPSLLVENFTWPWLYEPLVARAPRLGRHVEELARWFGRADAHLQTEPLCRPDPGAAAVLPPVGRPPRLSRGEARTALGLPADAPVVVVTMGGVSHDLPFLDRLANVADVHFLVTGVDRTRREGRLHLYDNRTRVYLPDFVRAADAVVAKLGYSTVAEVWGEGVPLAYVTRDDFRETGPLRRWVRDNLGGFEIPGRDFAAAGWIDRIPELLAVGRSAGGADGAGEGRSRAPAREAARRLAALGEPGG